MNKAERNLLAYLEGCVPKRVDTNQAEIVDALRRAGATVQVLSNVGKGCPDLLVGYDGDNYLLEVKDGSKAASRVKLTPDEERWYDDWDGQVAVVYSIEGALRVVGLMEPAL